MINLGITAGGKKHSDALMILNMRKAYDQILQITNRSTNVLTTNYVKDLHAVLARDLVLPSELGSIRSTPVSIGDNSYTPLVSANSLNEEMKYLIFQMQKIANPFERCIYAHLNICYLQYFIDCNKRTARFYQNALLIQSNILPLLFDSKFNAEYKKAVVSYYETGNSSEYVKWFIKAYSYMVGKLDPKDPVRKSRVFS